MSLLTRLLLLVVTAVLPIVANEAFDETELREQRRVELVTKALDLSDLVAEDVERIVDNVRQTLVTVAHVPAVIERDGESCNALFDELLVHFDAISSLATVDKAGNIYCYSGRARPGRSRGAEIAAFGGDSRGFQVGSFERDVATGEGLWSFTFPIVDRQEAILGWVAATLDLDRLADAIPETILPGRAIVTIADRNGIILARYPERQGVGETLPDMPDDLTGPTGKGVVAEDGDRISGYKLARVAPAVGVSVGISLDKNVAFAPLRKALRRHLLVAGIGLCLGLIGAWLVATYFIRRPIGQLLSVVSQWQRGNLAARVGAADSRSDVGRLAAAFDAMADGIVDRKRQLREQKERAEAAEKRAAAAWVRLEDAIAAIPEGVILFDAEDRLVLSNRKIREFLPRVADLLVPGTSYAELVVAAVQRRLIPGIEGREKEWLAGQLAYHRDPQGSIDQPLTGGRWLRLEERRTGDGGSVGICIDITELRQREASFRLLFESNPIPMWVCDRETLRFLEVNAATVAHYGYSRDEFLGMTILDIRPPEDIPALEKVFAIHDRHGCGVWRHRKKDGTILFADIIRHSITFGGRPASLVAAIDVTEQHQAEAVRLQLEAQLRHSAKMQALGTLAGGIAHDFNNLLLGMAGLLEMSIGEVAADSAMARRLGQVLDAVDQGRATVQQILAFSRRDEPRREPLGLVAVVERALALLEAAMPRRIVLRRHFAADGVVLGDAMQLQQVVLNLGSNALAAIAGEGRIDVGIERVELSEDEAAMLPGVGPGSYLRLTVADTGCGIAPEICERIFEPFFTTKPVGEGTGMGLAVVHGSVTAHGGAVTVDSEPGKGSVFTLHLPLADEALSPAEGEMLAVTR